MLDLIIPDDLATSLIPGESFAGNGKVSSRDRFFFNVILSPTTKYRRQVRQLAGGI
jgi:hypothetical protein